MAILEHRAHAFETTFKASLGQGIEEKPEGAFAIEVRFVSGLSQRQQGAFVAAAQRWTNIIIGNLPSVIVDGELIDDLLILAEGAKIDGAGGVLGQAGPTHLRPGSAGSASALPAKGRMTFDTADLEDMESAGTLDDVIAHEMGHVLGVGTIWDQKDLLKGAGSDNPTFIGQAAREEFGKLSGKGPTDIPVENSGGSGTADSHWREEIFRSELMSGFISTAGNPLSRLTAASLSDLGYDVRLEAAEAYALPGLIESFELGVSALRSGVDMHGVLPILPTMLPDDSLAE